MDGYQAMGRVLQIGSRYPWQVAWLRVGIGIWLLVLTAGLYGSGHGGEWGWLLPVTAVVHFGLAYRLIGITNQDPHRRMTFR